MENYKRSTSNTSNSTVSSCNPDIYITQDDQLYAELDKNTASSYLETKLAERSAEFDAAFSAASNVLKPRAESEDSSASLHMWEKRRLREEAEARADQKLLEAVMAASLKEYNQKKQAEEQFEREILEQTNNYNTESSVLTDSQKAAEVRKREAMQRVINSKAHAHTMSQKAREATKLYERKHSERLEKQSELEELERQRALQESLDAMKKKKDEAIKRRQEAELKAAEAQAKAAEMRQKAISAARVVRAHSQKNIEFNSTQEEAKRLKEKEQALAALEETKLQAKLRKENALKEAENARLRAEALKQRAEEAKLRSERVRNQNHTRVA